MSESPYPICEHIKDDGERCGSPARRGQKLCHFHGRAVQPAALPGKPGYTVPVAETAESLQITVTHVIQSLVNGAIDAKTANSIFRGLTLAYNSLRLPKSSGTAPRFVAQRVSAGNDASVLAVAGVGVAHPASEVSSSLEGVTLSPSALTHIRRIMRHGPKHPDFAKCSRLLDSHIASQSSA